MFTTFNTPYLATNQRADSRHFRPRVLLFFREGVPVLVCVEIEFIGKFAEM